MIRARLCLSIGLLLLLIASGQGAQGQNSFSDDIRKRAPSATLAPPPSASTNTNPAAASTVPASAAAPKTADPRFAEAALLESKDFGVAPTPGLRSEPLHAPTPTRIEGGVVISTQALHALYERKAGSFLVFDVLGGQQTLPGALNALPASRGNSFNDATQREFGNYLQQVTQGQMDLPLVFYCQSVNCWMSYNAALRAIRLGYTQVFWYRGGLEAWQQAALPTVAPNRFGR